MDQNIAKAADRPPVDISLGVLGLLGQPLARFAQSLQVTHHRILYKVRLHEPIAIFSYESLDAFDAFQYSLKGQIFAWLIWQFLICRNYG